MLMNTLDHPVCVYKLQDLVLNCTKPSGLCYEVQDMVYLIVTDHLVCVTWFEIWCFIVSDHLACVMRCSHQAQCRSTSCPSW